MVIANSFDPNWKASIDGRKIVPIIPANYVLQGVHIPEGSHHLTIFFFPDSLKTGFILSAIGLLAWVLLWIWGNAWLNKLNSISGLFVSSPNGRSLKNGRPGSI
jgi:uncharacterized membrane protein YfhO